MPIPPTLAFEYGLLVILAIVFLCVLGFLLFVGRFVALWLQAMVSGAHISLPVLVGMWLRRINPRTIVIAYIQAQHAGLDPDLAQLESHYLVGGNVRKVVHAMVAASRDGVILNWDDAFALDLAGHDILEQARTADAKGASQ